MKIYCADLIVVLEAAKASRNIKNLNIGYSIRTISDAIGRILNNFPELELNFNEEEENVSTS